MYRKKTLRAMQPVTRRYARNLNSLQGTFKRLQNLTQEIARLEADSHALFNRHQHENSLANRTGIDEATEILFGEEQTHEL
jgi:lipase chaperone LimK